MGLLAYGIILLYHIIPHPRFILVKPPINTTSLIGIDNQSWSKFFNSGYCNFK